MHASENVVCWLTAIDSEPDVDREPVQPPLAVHEVASVEDHVSVVLPPVATLVGFADRDTAGAGRIVTVA